MANRIVSIDLHIDEVGAGMLCYGHAERVVVPKGWTLEDLRIHEPRLFDVGRPENRMSAYDHLDDEPNEPAAEADEAAPRKERKRRKLLPSAQSGVGDEVGSTPGQMVFNGYEPPEAESDEQDIDAYDLPGGYRNYSNESDSADSDQLGGVRGESPDRETNPLLARAFDVTRSRQTPAQLRSPSPKS